MIGNSEVKKMPPPQVTDISFSLTCTLNSVVNQFKHLDWHIKSDSDVTGAYSSKI